MSLQGLNSSDFGSLTNTNCSNFTTIDLSNASTTVINYFIHNHIQPVWITIFCVSLFGLITNSSFIVIVVRTPSLHTTTYILLTCLACSNCIILITHLEANAQILFEYTTIDAGFIVSRCLFVLCASLSTGFVVLASAERFLAICHPLTHQRLKGTKRTAKSIAIVFLISIGNLGMCVPIYLSYSVTKICIIWQEEDQFHTYLHQRLMQNPDKWLFVYSRIFYGSFGVVFFLILASVSYMYAKILVTLAQRKRNTDLHMSAGFKKHIEQISSMVIITGGVYFLLMSILITNFILASVKFIYTRNLIYWGYVA